jgi:hypothetical protein
MVIFHLFFIISELILFVFFILLIIKYKKHPKSKELVWKGSKIYTIRQILIDNRNNKYPITDIISLNETLKLDKNYEYLLQHSTKGECEQNFKKCGILDTYGNIICLPDTDSCPINEIIIDAKENEEQYINKGYNSVNISELPDNYMLYYTNRSINKEIVVDLNISEENPRYIIENNFIFDKETFLKNIKVVIIFIDGDDYESHKNIEEILCENEKNKQYIINKFNEEKNIDKYYKKIYDNLYTKNYIGFESYEQMNSFMNIDLHHLYFKKFPNKISYIFAILCLVFIFIFLIILCCTPKSGNNIIFIVIFGSIYLLIRTGFFVYFIYGYLKIYKNKELKDIQKINADDFIRNYIDEIYKRFSDDKYILVMIILLGSSMLFFILTVIISLCKRFLRRNKFNKMYKEKVNNTVNVTGNVTEKAIENIATTSKNDIN